MERKRARKKEVPAAYYYTQQVNNNKHNLVAFYKIWKNNNEIQLLKCKFLQRPAQQVEFIFYFYTEYNRYKTEKKLDFSKF